MSRIVPSKRASILTFVLVLSVFLIATTASADIRLIEAEEGGTVRAEKGAELVIPPGALAEDTVISAELDVQNDAIYLLFGPHGTVFSPSAVFKVSWTLTKKYDIQDYTAYGPDGETLIPKITKRGLEYEVPHFSIYYFRRR